MKSWIRHIAFLIVVVVVTSLAYYDYYKSQKSDEQLTKAEHFIKNKNFKNLEEIKIQTSTDNILLVKQEEDWLLKKPLKDQASFSEVARWFSEIQNQKVKEIKPDKPIVWKDYYLEQAPSTPSVSLKFSSGEELTFSVSSKSSFDEQFFIKKDNKLFLGQMHFNNEINAKEPNSFRNHKILLKSVRPYQISIKNSSGQLNFYWENYSWHLKDLDKDEVFPLDKQKLTDFWNKLSSIKATSLKEKKTYSTLKKYKLNSTNKKYKSTFASKKITLTYKDKKPIVISISPTQNRKIYINSSVRDYILEFEASEIQSLLISKKDIRKKPIVKPVVGSAVNPTLRPAVNLKESLNMNLKESLGMKKSIDRKAKEPIAVSPLKEEITTTPK